MPDEEKAGIRYTNTLEDMAAFYAFEQKRTGVGRFTTFLWYWGFPVVMTVYSLFRRGEESLALRLLAAIILTGMWLVVIRWLYPRIRRWIVSAVSDSSLLCEYELVLTPEYLVGRSDRGETKVKLERIERILSDGNRFYVYVTEKNAHVIPAERLAEGDAETFIASLRKGMEARSEQA
jgi:hypothetical protein